MLASGGYFGETRPKEERKDGHAPWCTTGHTRNGRPRRSARGNLQETEDATHGFRADAPNEVWVTDVTEFAIPSGKAYLSAVVDCFDGMPVGWTVSRSPDAKMADSSLPVACGQLSEGERPVVHSDRGCHYRWPGWISICDDRGLARSMSRKGCSADNARCEGFFGRPKTEFFHGVDWGGSDFEGFASAPGGYLWWYRDERLKSDLGYRSPAQYRRDLGLIAQDRPGPGFPPQPQTEEQNR